MRKGSKMTLEQKRRVSESHMGQKQSQETINKRVEKLRGNTWGFKKEQIPWNKGKKYSNPEISKRMSESQKNLWSNLEHRKRMSEAHKGFVVSEETKIKLREINRGKKMSPESIKKMVELRIKKGSYQHSEESKRKISMAGKGKSAWNKGINFPEDSERSEWQINVAKKSRERLLRMYESGKFPLQENTSIERAIKTELIKRGYKEGVDFIHQFKFMNKFMCDFCFPQQKVIVEAYGDFWHANPKKYPQSTNLHPHQIKGKRIDKSKEAYIKKVDNGSWTYLTLWESDIKENLIKCVDKIEEMLKKKDKEDNIVLRK